MYCKRLRELLIDKDMQKKDLCVATGIITNAITNLGNGENVLTEVIGKIYTVLKCEINVTMEIVDEKPKQANTDD